MTSEERGHSIFSASVAERIVHCSASVALSAKAPTPVPSPKAKEGTDAHAVADMVLSDFLAHKITGSDPDIRAHLLTSNLEFYNAAHEYKTALWENLLGQSITGKAYGIEERLDINPKLSMHSFTDFWALHLDNRGKRAGLVADYKYGIFEVQAEKNVQLAFYACALREEVRRGGKDLDYVRAAIFQPRLISGEKYKETKFTAKQLDTWYKKFMEVAEKIFVTKKVRFKAGKWCYFCPANGICKHYGKTASVHKALELVDPTIATLPEVTSLTDEQRLRIVANYDTIKNFIDAVYNTVFTEVKEGYTFGDTLKIIQTAAGKRKWKKDLDPVELAGYFESFGIPESDLYLKELVNISTLQAKLKTKITGGDTKAKEIISKYCDLSAPSLSLVPFSDPREPIETVLSVLKHKEIENEGS